MSIFNKLGKGLGLSTKELDVEEYMNAAEMDDVDIMHEPAEHYVKPVALEQQEDVEQIKRNSHRQHSAHEHQGDGEEAEHA